MKTKVGVVAVTILSATLTLSTPARAQAFTGDVRYACEAILCLAAPSRPSECTAAITKYFSISARKFKDTLTKRKNFLALCPKADVDLDQIVVNSTPSWPDPVDEPPPSTLPTFPPTPNTRAGVEALIMQLTPVWNALGKLSTAAYDVVLNCVNANGRVQDGFCKAEMAAFEAAAAPTRAYRDEIYRLQAILATMS